MSEQADPLVIETASRLFRNVSTFETVERAEGERWCEPVWDALVEAGFPWVSIPESAGGSGGSLFDLAAILRAAGAYSAPVPLAETAMLGGWLLGAAGLALPDGAITVVSDPGSLRLVGGRVQGSAKVAWAQRSDRIVALVGNGTDSVVASIVPSQVSITPGANMAGEPRDTVSFDVALADVESAPAPDGVDGRALIERGSVSRVVLAAGAIETMTQLAVDYTSVRRQFGKPVGSFQAVQQHLVIAAQSSARASMAAQLAVRSLARASGGFDTTAARIVIDDASVLATRAVHQAHGAMGVTREYPLHHLSRRLWSWRHEYRSGAKWKQDLGRAAVAGGGAGLFTLVTG